MAANPPDKGLGVVAINEEQLERMDNNSDKLHLKINKIEIEKQINKFQSEWDYRLLIEIIDYINNSHSVQFITVRTATRNRQENASSKNKEMNTESDFQRTINQSTQYLQNR